MSGRTYDLAIIGGGITGACVARDAALRGLAVAIIDKGDWSSGTSAASSKLVHGGLRYLKSLEFGLIRESLQERRVWERIAPHMVTPLTFLVPLKKGSLKDRLTLSAGLTLYDWLSYDKAWLEDPDQRLKSHWVLNAADARATEPLLDSPDIGGAIAYQDCQMLSPERLGLECVIDAVENGADAANYAEATTFLKSGSTIEGVRARDLLTGSETEIRAKITLNAAGPWADFLLAKAQNGTPSRHLLRSKGIHLIVPAMTKGAALTVAHKGGHFFVLPWRGHTILGTTDTEYKGLPDDVRPEESDIASFLDFINEGLPTANLSRDQVLHAYAGLRPLVDDGSKSSYNASRKAEIADHEAEGAKGLLSAIGGKWTTSRALAQSLVDLVQAKLGQSRRDPQTGHRPLPGGATGALAAYRRSAEASHPDMGAALCDMLIRTYGARHERIWTKAKADPALGRPLSNRAPDIAAQIVYAVRHEMAVHLDDVVLRRTGLGTLGHPGSAALAAAGDIMAAELNWTPAQKQEEMARLSHHYRRALAAA